MEILGEYTTSVKKSLEEIDPNWESYTGLMVCGTHNPQNVEEFIQKIKEARENKIPFLGLCFGHQLAFIEQARNVLGIKDATSEEFGKGTFVIRRRPNGLRVGIYPVKIKGEIRLETFWHYFEVNPEFWIRYFPGMLPTDNIDMFEGDDHPFFWTVQFHPEYQSSKENPHPILVNFLNACKNYGR